jgi:hypothetical protein
MRIPVAGVAGDVGKALTKRLYRIGDVVSADRSLLDPA